MKNRLFVQNKETFELLQASNSERALLLHSVIDESNKILHENRHDKAGCAELNVLVDLFRRELTILTGETSGHITPVFTVQEVTNLFLEKANED